MCQVLTVSKSGYYAWEKRVPSKRATEDTVLKIEILDIFWKSRFTSGIWGTYKALQERGFHCGRHRTRRLLREMGLFPKTLRKYKATTNSKHSYPVSPNLLEQDFTAPAPDVKWVSDITYISTDEGWLYLCVFIDLFSRMIVGWSMKERMTADLVMDAFLHAVWRRRPSPGLIVHSDRGSQYACHAFRDLLAKHHAVSSMSKKGDCYDNAVSESFFGTLKTECVYHEKYHTRKEARASIFDYIEPFYNRTRRHSTLGYKTPLEFEALKLVA
jgi:transposase InsO family protein